MKTKLLRKFRAAYTYGFRDNTIYFMERKDSTIYFMERKNRHAFIKYSITDLGFFIAAKYCGVAKLFARVDVVKQRMARLQYFNALR